MAEPFVGEVRLWGINWAPRGWMLCNGARIEISQNPALYSLIGTQFGGDGRTNFNVPDLRARVPMHPGNSVPQQGVAGGSETVTLNQAQMPMHTHGVASASALGDTNQPADSVFTHGNAVKPYTTPADLVEMAPDSVTSAGNGQAHSNLQPTLALTFTIALQGLYPSRN
ncbi:MAG: tail fiber protein [Rhodovibrio sp.]|nr:tail fiber protein [Rhodovibrio sp.]